MQKEKGPLAPVINVVLPENFGIFQDRQRIQPGFAPSQSNLLPADGREGSRMDLDSFCVFFNVSDKIKKRLQDNAITGTHAFAHLSDGKLESMGFLIGEMIDFKEAVKEWAAQTSDCNC